MVLRRSTTDWACDTAFRSVPRSMLSFIPFVPIPFYGQYTLLASRQAPSHARNGQGIPNTCPLKGFSLLQPENSKASRTVLTHKAQGGQLWQMRISRFQPRTAQHLDIFGNLAS